MKKTIVIILILVTLLIAIAYAGFEVEGDLEVMGDLIITSDQSGGPIWAMGSDIIATTGYLTIEAEIMWLDGEICHVPDLRPIADNAYALGGSTKRWNTIWCAENAYYGPTPREYGVSTQYGLNIGGGAIFGTVDANAVLDDLTIAGTFSGTGATDIDYKVEIDGEGTPDTFKWSDDGGSTWDATTVSITGSAQTLNNGVTITFAATTGHTSGDYWTWDMEIRNPIFLQDATGDGIMWVGNDGKVGINTESPATILDVSGTGTFDDITISTPSNIYALSHDSFADFEPNEHLDWTGESANFLTSGTLGAGAITGTSLTLNMTQDYLFTKRAGSLAIQSQTAATPFGMELFTAAGDGTDALNFRLFAKGLPADITNSEYLAIGYIGDLVPYNFLIHSQATGTGTVRPIILYTGANSGQFTLAITGDNTMSGALDVTGAVTGGSLVIDTTALVVDAVNDRVGIGTSSPDSVFHIKAGTPGTIGSHPAGQLIIQNPTNSVFACAVITGYESDGDGNPDQQLWYLGSSSSSNSDIIFLNRRNSKLALGTNGSHRITILGNGNIGINETAPQDKLEVNGTGLFKDKLKFTQDDGNEYIDSLADGYMDYGATTAHRFNSPIEVSQIGVAADTDLLQLADGVLTVNGTVTLPSTNKINFRDSDISIGSPFDGTLDISADVSVDFFYDNADVGDAVDGQSIYINRRAGEGDDYIRLYVDKDRKGLIGFSGDDDLLQLAANALTVNGALTATGAITGGSLVINTTDLVVDAVNHKVEIGSADGSDKIQIYHDNDKAIFTTSDGPFTFITDEGDNTNSYLDIKGKGTGYGEIRIFDQDNNEYLSFFCSNGHAYLGAFGTTPASLRLQSDAAVPITMFAGATEGETQELQIYGYRTADGVVARSLQIGVGVDADATASFKGTVHTFLFKTDYGLNAHTILDISGKGTGVGVLKIDGTQVITTQQAHIADADNSIAAAAGDPPTKAEFDALVTAYNDLATKFNTLLAYLDADAGHGLLAGAP